MFWKHHILFRNKMNNIFNSTPKFNLETLPQCVSQLLLFKKHQKRKKNPNIEVHPEKIVYPSDMVGKGLHKHVVRPPKWKQTEMKNSHMRKHCGSNFSSSAETLKSKLPVEGFQDEECAKLRCQNVAIVVEYFSRTAVELTFKRSSIFTFV